MTTMTNKVIIMDITEGVSFEDLTTKNESVYFNVIDTATGESINNIKKPIYGFEGDNTGVYFGERQVPLSQCEFFMMEFVPNDDWERNMYKKIPNENTWSEYTPLRQIIFKFLKDKYSKIGTMYCNDEAWKRIRSTFTELNAKGEDKPDLTMSRLEAFLNEISIPVSVFFDKVGPIARSLFAYDLLDDPELVLDSTGVFHDIDVFNKNNTYMLLTSVLIKALYANIQHRILKPQMKRLRSLIVKLPKIKDEKDVTFSNFKKILEMFNIKYTDVLCNIELYKEAYYEL